MPRPRTPFEALSRERLSFPEARPVFIVGSVRSGTSIMINALRDGAGIRGFSEGNVASLFQRMLDAIEDQQRLLEEYRLEPPGRESREELERLATCLPNYVTALYAQIMGTGRWLDKSPESYLGAPMIRYAPQLQEALPEARFVFCIRRGIENVMSRQRKFPEIPFRSCCISWADAARNWIAVRDRLDGRYLEVHQHRIAVHPDEVARALAVFLGFSDDQRQAVEDIFTHRRFEQSQFAQDHRFIGLDETPWDEEQRQLFREHCAEMMGAFGYDLGPQVLRPAGPVRLFFPVAEESIERIGIDADPESFRREGERGLQLRPNPPGQEPAGIRYLNVPLSGQSRFRATLHVPRRAAGAVVFRFRVERSESGATVSDHRCRVDPGQRETWDTDFPPLDGVFNVVIATEMAEGAASARHAAAIFEDARLESGS
jgi:hypothetical protein